MSRKKEVSRKCELGTFPLSGLEPINQGYTERSFEKDKGSNKKMKLKTRFHLQKELNVFGVRKRLFFFPSGHRLKFKFSYSLFYFESLS